MTSSIFKRYQILISTALAIFLALSVTEIASPQTRKGSIRGKVTDKKTGDPLVGVNVQIMDTFLGASTDESGQFVITNIPVGTHSVRFSMIGYRMVFKKDIRVFENQSTTLNAALSETVIGLNPVIVTASKRQQDLTVTPHSVVVMPVRELIERTPMRLDDALESVAGVHFVERHINIRGSSGYTRGVGSRVLLLVDGVPMMISDTNEINWNIIPIMDIDQVEVIKGAGSALYGSNALGGIVNVITKAPSQKGRFRIRWVGGMYDDPPYNQWKWTDRQLKFDRVDMSYSKKFGRLGIHTYYGQQKSTGYTTDGFFERYNASTKLTYQFKDASNLTLYGGWSYEDRGEFVEWENPNQPLESSYWFSDRRVRINMFDGYLLYRRPVTATLAMKLRASFISSLFGDQYERSTDYYPAQGIGAEIQGDWIPFKNHSLAFGFEYKHDGGHTKFIGNRSGYSIAPYLQNEWHVLKNLTLTPGIRYDSYTVVNSHFRESYLNPKMGINYRPFENTVLRFSGGTAFRAASVTERFINASVSYFDIVPNEDLKAETSHSYDLGIRQQITSNWWIDAAFFHNDYYNFIEPVAEMLDNFDVQVQFRNVTRARIRGFEFATKGRMWRNRIGLDFNMTLMDPKVLPDGTRQTESLDDSWLVIRDVFTGKLDRVKSEINSGEILAYRPKVLGFAALSLRSKPVEFQVEYRYASRIDQVKLFTLDPRVDQRIWNFRVKFYWHKLNVIFSLNNAFNYAYTTLERNLGEIRNISTSVMWEL